MKYLWTYIDSKNWTEENKYKVVLLISTVVFALIGLAVWLIIRHWALSTLDWMICFAGYPAAFSWFVVIFYSCRHAFHNGNAVK